MELLAVKEKLDVIFEPGYGEEWDNTGLLLGSLEQTISRALICLTITPEVIQEARDKNCEMIISHHPFPFKKQNRFISTNYDGNLLLALASASLAVYSPHTIFDGIGEFGIAETFFAKLGYVGKVRPLLEDKKCEGRNIGRYIKLEKAISVEKLCLDIKKHFTPAVLKISLAGLKRDALISRIGFSPGSAAEHGKLAVTKQCDIFVTGEASFHSLLEYRFQGLGMILMGHYYSERFGVESLCKELGARIPGVECILSDSDTNPYQIV